MPKILIVDDEPSIVELLKYNLENNHFIVDIAVDGAEAIEKITNNEYDLVVLDLMLPKIDGMEVIRQTRSKNISVPIILLTAKDDDTDKIVGLEVGADDYLTKPFNIRELMARIKAILRRTIHKNKDEKTDSSQKVFNIDQDNYQVSKNGQLLNLTKTEYRLFRILYENKNHTLTREQILNNLWGVSKFESQDTRSIDIQVSHLREKIEHDPHQPEYLKTIRGFGYRLNI